jgi:hypothetical protein
LTTSRQRFRRRRTEDPGQDPHRQDVQSSAIWLHLRPFPYKRDPRDNSPPRTTSLFLARQISALHDKSLPRTTNLRLQLVRGPQCAAQGPSTTTDERGGAIPHVMQVQQLAAMQAAHPDKSLNAGLTSCVTIPSPSSLAMPTQALPEALKHPLRRARA